MMITLPQQNIKMDVPTGIDPVWYGKLQALIKEVNLLGGIVPPAGATPITASLGGNINLTSAHYVDGPAIAQGASGTWWVAGIITFLDTAGPRMINSKLWDGTTVIASASTVTTAANSTGTSTLAGFITSPAGNLKISAIPGSGTTSVLVFNSSGNSRDCTISAFRIA